MKTTSAKYFHVRGRRVIRFDQYNRTPADKALLKKSKRWSTLKERAIQYYDSCVICGVRKGLELHHRYYFTPPHPIDDYELLDVSILCTTHHDMAHEQNRHENI